tara:strand:+ start:130 stop:780 length:651 start_codon:yes stop_codon:yes gene_type:complete
MKGLLLVLEGIDGCGKSTQIRHLSSWLPKSGLMPKGTKLYVTKEPGGTSLGASLRELLLHPPKDNAPEPLTELLLYAADRAQHISQFVSPIIEKGDWVISDRLSGSTLAYQGYGRELDKQLIKQLELIALQGLDPDITIFLEVSLKESVKRRETELDDRIEAEGNYFLEKVAAGFKEISQERKWINIQADLEATIVSKKIEEEIKKYFFNKKLVAI